MHRDKKSEMRHIQLRPLVDLGPGDSPISQVNRCAAAGARFEENITMRAGTLLAAGAMASALTMLGAATAAAEPANTMPEDGLYLVGVDIFPGWWEAPGAPDRDHACDWRRLWKVEGDNTDMRNIIGNDYTRGGRVLAEIKPTDVAFKTKNCGPWRLVPAPPRSGSFGG
ncbi:hypothetical protein [Nocardia brasiliensis]